MSTLHSRETERLRTGSEGRPSRLARLLAARAHPTGLSYLLALGAVVVATGLSFVIFPLEDLANIVLVYLLAVMLVAAKLGRGPSVLATVVGVASFVFFFVPHYYSFVLSDLRYLPTFLILLFVGLVVASLTSQLRHEAITTKDREKRTQALYLLSRGLAAAETREHVVGVVSEHVGTIFACRCRVLEFTPAGLVPCPRSAPTAAPAEDEMQQALSALRERKTRKSHGSLLLPLVVANESVGVLCCDGIAGQLLEVVANVHLLEAFANNVAIALHRLVVDEDARSTQRRVEEERLRNILLSSMSHDFRTPLASITGAVTTLIDSAPRLDDATRADLLQSIREDADFLEHQIRNLLDLTRLESGTLQIQCELHPLDEVIGGAMTRAEKPLEGRRVEIDVSAQLPLVAMDALLVERLLVNLLENAVRYAPTWSAIEVGARQIDDRVRIEVADRGPGIPRQLHDRVFEKFFRVGGTRSNAGAGLGLAICKAIAQLHLGRIWVEDRPGGGAVFVVEMPIGSDQCPVPDATPVAGTP